MTCGEELKSYQTRRYLVLPEIALGLASSYIDMGVELLDGDGGPQGYPLQPNSEYHSTLSRESVRGR